MPPLELTLTKDRTPGQPDRYLLTVKSEVEGPGNLNVTLPVNGEIQVFRQTFDLGDLSFMDDEQEIVVSFSSSDSREVTETTESSKVKKAKAQEDEKPL